MAFDNWQSRLAQTLPAPLHTLLHVAIELAAERRVPLFLVGGPVRDAYLHQPISDLDLVIEGDAWPLAEAFADRTNGKLTLHEKFRTAVVEVPHNGSAWPIDLVTARRETYAAPAALPDIAPSSIDDDLRRRDFTINTLALRLDPERWSLLDPFNGLRDIDQGIVRVLHDRSFLDDPTRILRAARFAGRLEFAVEPHTTQLIDAALAQQMIARTTPQRILHEIYLLLNEPRPEAVLAQLNMWNALAQLELRWTDAWVEHFRAARAAHWSDTTTQALGFGLLIWPLDRVQRQAFASRYNLATGERTLLRELPHGVPAALAEARPSAIELERLLQPLSMTALRVLQLVGSPQVAANIEQYLHTIRALPPLLTGDDLRAAGIPPGPLYRALLSELRRLQLAGQLTGVEQARRWLRERATDDKPHS